MGQNMLVGTCIQLSLILIFLQPHKSQKHSMTFSFFLRFPEILLYSKIIPHIGKVIVGEREPYEYLTKSIEIHDIQLAN